MLASASPARLRLLRDAGIDAMAVVSGVDEDAVVAALAAPQPAEIVQRLAQEKARAVAATTLPAGAIVVGCDSLLVHEGEVFGKPKEPAVALARWRRMRGTEGSLLTGHCVVDTELAAEVVAFAGTTVRFGAPSDEEIAAYVDSGEPLSVAGGFTLDGRSAPFITGIDGDPGNVIGLSLPLLRELLARLGVGMTQLWR